jgi:hypothetical protein
LERVFDGVASTKIFQTEITPETPKKSIYDEGTNNHILGI